MRVKQKTLEVLALMTLAITARRLYPPKNPMVINAIDNLYNALQELFKNKDFLLFAEADKNLLVYDEPLNRNEHKQPKIAALLELLINFEIKSVTVDPDVTREDLSIFVDILSQTPEAVSASGGIKKVMADRKVGRILLGQKLYVAKTDKSKLLASIDIDDDEIMQYLASAKEGVDEDQIRKMAQDRDWLAQIFKRGMNRTLDGQPLSDTQGPAHMAQMMSMLDKIVDKKDREEVERLITSSIAELDADTIGHILSQNIDHYFHGKLLPDILAQLDGTKIDRLIDIISHELKKGDSLPGSDKEKLLQQLMEAKEGHKREGIDSRPGEMPPIMVERDDQRPDDPLPHSLAGIVDKLGLPVKHDAAESLTERLAEGLLSDRQDIRDKVSATLTRIIEGLSRERQKAIVEQLSPTLMRWILLETNPSGAHKKLSNLLKGHMLILVQEHRYAALLPLVNAFYLIDQGLLEKPEEIRATASEVIQELARWYRLDNLFEAYEKSYDEEKMDIGRILARLGTAPLQRLMDVLRDHPDSNERVRIMHVIREIGPAAIPVIEERSRKDYPWYHHRNLAYLLRFIKSPATVEILQRLMRHKHQKVREEALESLYLVGENERGPVLLSLLPTADDAFKKSIIEILGKIRYREAATVLIELLKDRPLLANSARKDLEEVICIALGRIGTPEAAALLNEISKQKFYHLTSYAEKVRKAAAQALLSIKPLT